MAKFYTPTKLSENIRETPEGYLLCLGVPIARTGWQLYGDGETPLKVGKDGTVKIHREAKEVFRPETIASFQGKSVTIKHPEDFVAPENWKDLTKGSAQNVRRGDEKDEDGEESLLSDLLITELLAIQLVKNGLREVSCGYEAEYEQTGEGEGRQFNIIGNHIALVEEGRAGSAYAINDHKGKVSNIMPSKLIEKLKARFGAKVIDEAMAEEKKEDKKDPAKDAYDELMKAVKDFGEKMGKAKDEEKEEPKKEEPKKEEKPAKDEEKEEPKKEEKPAKDEDGEEMKIEERIKALEAAVSKLLDMESEESEESEDEESEEKEDGESEDEESEEEESSLTGDTAARIEILAPGLKPIKKGEDIKQRALVTAFGTKEGREAIEAITGSKKLVLDSAEKISTLFIAASEVLKAQRGTGLEKTKDAKSFDSFDPKVETMTADKMNELNAAHWARK